MSALRGELQRPEPQSGWGFMKLSPTTFLMIELTVLIDTITTLALDPAQT